MFYRYVFRFALLSLAVGMAGCAGSSGELTGTPELGAAPVTLPIVSQARQELPGLSLLPVDAGLSLRATSSAAHELLDHAPVSTSGASSADYQSGSVTLKPAANGGLAWAVFELFSFPTDASVKPDSVNSTASGEFYLGVSNYTAKHWQFTPAGISGVLSLGSGPKFHSATGSMYVVAVATGSTDVMVSSLSVNTPAALPNDGLDEHENNDDSAHANPLPTLPVVGFKGNLGAGGYDGDTNDYFSFPTTEGQVVTLSLSFPQSANYTLTLYKPGGSIVAAKDDQGNPGARHVTVGMRAGTCVVKVSAAAGSGDYTLDASLTAPGYTEVEDNDSTAAANNMPGGNIVGSVGASSYDGDTSDYYYFQAQEGDVATLTLTYPAGSSNLSLALLNAAGTQISKDSAGNPGLRSFSWGLHAGTSYILVKAESGSSDYTLNLALDHPGYSEVEDNDSFATAQPLPNLPVAGLSGSCGAFGYDGDANDYFTFPCDDGDIVSVSLGYDQVQGNLSLTLYNADQTPAFADTTGNSGTRSFAWGLRGGQCFVAVKGTSGSSDYTLDISKTTPGYDETENNDLTSTADILPALPINGFKGSVGVNGYDGDLVDYYTFSAQDKDLFSFSLTYNQAVSNIELDLLNAAGQVIYADANGNSGTRGFNWGLKAGDYYLKIGANSGTSDYLLNVVKAQPLLDETEDNDTRPSAQQLPALPFPSFAGHCGKFGYDGDNDDYFFFNLAGSVPFSSSLSYSAASGTLKYYLLDGSGTTVASDTAGNPGTRTVGATIGPGTYYLHVQCSAGGTDYGFSASDS